MQNPVRRPMPFRLSDSGQEWLNGVAIEASTKGHLVNRSEVMRASLRVAMQHKDEVLAILAERTEA